MRVFAYVAIGMALLLSGCRTRQTQSAEGAVVQFDETVYNFGDVNEAGGVVSHTFSFENRGDEPVVLTEALTACVCTRATFTRTPVLPGQRAQIVVSYDPNYRPGPFSKEVNIYYNGRSGHSSIWIKGRVLPCRHPMEEDHPYDLGEIRTNLKVLLFGGMRSGESRSLKFRFGNALEEPVHLRFQVKGATADALQLPDTVSLMADERREVTVTYTMPASALGLQRLTVQPVVNGKPAAEAIEVSAIGLPQRDDTPGEGPAAQCADNMLFVEPREGTQTFALTLANEGNDDLRVLSVDLPEHVTSSLRVGDVVPRHATRSFDVHFRASASEAASYHDRIYIVTNDPVRSYLTIHVNTKK